MKSAGRPDDARRDEEKLIPKHGGYRHLKSFQVAEVVYDVTVRFCNRFIDRRSRTHDQMVQAARSGVQNIAEGSVVSGTSRKMEMKLTKVARASLEELRRDYQDFLRQRGLSLWEWDDPRRAGLIARRPATADDVAAWARDVKHGQYGQHGQEDGVDGPASSVGSMPARALGYGEIAANGALGLIAVASSLLDRQVEAQAEAFGREGGFTERLYDARRAARRRHPPRRYPEGGTSGPRD